MSRTSTLVVWGEWESSRHWPEAKQTSGTLGTVHMFSNRDWLFEKILII